ncbi:MAG: hypothetical protein SangKO_095650 [Sandaracinaceae bacterium]
MSWWSPKHALRSFIFTDGQIEAVSRDGDALVVSFRDYGAALVRLRFSGVTEHWVSEDACHIGTMSARFERSGGLWTALLRDDDEEPLLRVTYVDATHSFIEQG